MQDDLDTSHARREILSRIRTLQGRPESYKAGEQQQASDYLKAHPRGPLPSAVDDVYGLFIERSKAMLSTVAEVATSAESPSAVAQYLTNENLAGKVAIWPALKAFDWSCLGELVSFGRANGDDLIGVSGVAYAVAETGTLVFASRSDEPSSTHLLPETHIAIVKRSQVVHTMEDAFDRLRSDDRAMPRALNFVSGPSRTADIEQTIVLGAHGPYRVHLIMVTDE